MSGMQGFNDPSAGGTAGDQLRKRWSTLAVKLLPAIVATALAIAINFATDGGSRVVWIVVFLLTLLTALITTAEGGSWPPPRQLLRMVAVLCLLAFALSADLQSVDVAEGEGAAAPVTTPPSLDRVEPSPQSRTRLPNLLDRATSARLAKKLTAEFKNVMETRSVFLGDLIVRADQQYVGDVRYNPSDPLKFNLRQGALEVHASLQDPDGRTADFTVSVVDAHQYDPISPYDPSNEQCRTRRLDSNAICNEFVAPQDDFQYIRGARYVSTATKDPRFRAYKNEGVEVYLENGASASIYLTRNTPEPDIHFSAAGAIPALSTLVETFQSSS